MNITKNQLKKAFDETRAELIHEAKKNNIPETAKVIIIVSTVMREKVIEKLFEQKEGK